MIPGITYDAVVINLEKREAAKIGGTRPTTMAILQEKIKRQEYIINDLRRQLDSREESIDKARAILDY